MSSFLVIDGFSLLRERTDARQPSGVLVVVRVSGDQLTNEWEGSTASAHLVKRLQGLFPLFVALFE
jgi:hypothetical protein